MIIVLDKKLINNLDKVYFNYYFYKEIIHH